MSRQTWFLSLLMVVLPSVAHGEVCSETSNGLSLGPIGLSFAEGDRARPRRACPRTEISLSGTVAAIDVADDLLAGDGNFYATMFGGGELSGSWAFSPYGEIFGTLQMVQFRFVQNATLSRTHASVGWASFGATTSIWGGNALRVAATARLTLPTAMGTFRYAVPFAFDLGVTGEFQVMSKLWIHAQTSIINQFVLGSGDPGSRAALQLVTGVEYLPFSWLELVLDVEAQFGYDTNFDQLSVAAGIGFEIWKGFQTELAAMLPLAGSSRADMAALIKVTYRF